MPGLNFEASNGQAYSMVVGKQKPNATSETNSTLKSLNKGKHY